MNLNFEKSSGLIPAIIQDINTSKVLMLGFMNPEALAVTQQTGLVTFYSRTKERLWTKGETSGNVLRVVEITPDCDADTLLIKVIPTGPVCHTGDDTCFKETNTAPPDPFLHVLEGIIINRKQHPSEKSYTTKLLGKGINKIAQKVGEEAVELVIEAKDNNDDLFIGEAADLLYHTLVLFAAKNISLNLVLAELRHRHQKK